MRDDYCQRLRRAIVNGYVEQEELTSEEERRMKFLEKGSNGDTRRWQRDSWYMKLVSGDEK